MLSLLIGNKGSGKTKRLIDRATKALEESKGSIVVIEKGAKLTYEISHKARLIDTEAYAIVGEEAMFGFVSGICAANYDVTDILIDSTLKIIGKDMKDLEILVDKLHTLIANAETNIVLSISADEADLPNSIKKYIAE